MSSVNLRSFRVLGAFALDYDSALHIVGSAHPKQIVCLRRPRRRRARRQHPIPAPGHIHDTAHLGFCARRETMCIRPRYPGTRAGCERLREKADELIRVDEFGEGVRAGLDEAEELFGRHDREEVRQRRACNRRQE